MRMQWQHFREAAAVMMQCVVQTLGGCTTLGHKLLYSATLRGLRICENVGGGGEPVATRTMLLKHGNLLRAMFFPLFIHIHYFSATSNSHPPPPTPSPCFLFLNSLLNGSRIYYIILQFSYFVYNCLNATLIMPLQSRLHKFNEFIYNLS